MDELKQLNAELIEFAASKLKPMHLKIAQGLIDGKTQEKAYVDAGGKGKDPIRCASEIISENPNISEYVLRFRKITQMKLLPKQIATFEQKKQMLWDAALHCSEKIVKGEGEDADCAMRDPRAMRDMISELNKMDGDLKPVQTENLHLHKFEALTPEELDDRIAQLQRKIGAGAAS